MIRKQEHKDETFYYHNDHLGTPKVMTDKLKKVVWNVEFDPFGNEIGRDKDDDGDDHGHNGRYGKYIRKVINNLRFPGQYFDKESGLHQNGFRDYNPETGTYPQGDPIGLFGGMNPYSYGNNPVNFMDPMGLAKSNVEYWLGDCPAEEMAVCEIKCASRGGVKSCKVTYSCRPTVRGGKVMDAIYKVPGSMNCACNDDENCPDNRTFREKLRDAWDNFNDIMQKLFPDPNRRPNTPYPPPPPVWRWVFP